MKDKKFISTTELAKFLGISRIAVYKQIKNKKINAIKVGRNFVIDKKDLGGIFSDNLNQKEKMEIDKSVRKTVKEYGKTLKLLGKT